MSDIILFANSAISKLAGAIGPADVTATLSPGTGSLFPAPVAGQIFKMTFTDAATGLLNEIVNVTNRAGDVITFVRAQEGTVAQSWAAGSLAANLDTAGTMQAMLQTQQIYPTRVVKVGGVIVIDPTLDKSIGLLRTAANTCPLPVSALCYDGQEFYFDDLSRNLNQYPAVISPGAGDAFPAAAANYTCNVNGSSTRFRLYKADKIWSIGS